MDGRQPTHAQPVSTYIGTMPPKFLESLHDIRSSEIVVPPGMEFVAEGQECAHVYLVRKGLGLRAKLLHDGRRQVLNVLFPGDIVGLQAMALGCVHHNAEARSSMTLSVIEHQRIRALWVDEIDTVLSLFKAMAEDEVQLMRAMLWNGQLTAEEAVAAVLLSIFSRGRMLGMVTNGHMSFPFRQVDIADMLGLSLVHTNKMIARLRRAGYIELSDGRLSVAEPISLAEAYNLDLVVA